MRKNKIELRRAIEEEVQECSEEMESRFGDLLLSLFDDGLEGEEVTEIIERERMLHYTRLNTGQINQFYRVVR